MEEFGRLFSEFRSSATRIETLDVYSVPEERDNLDLYRSGAPLPPDRNEEWARSIRECVAAGKYMGRVHIIDHVLTPYLQFEIDWYYAVNGAAGEDIRFIFRDDVPDIPYTDTWLFDDEIVVDLSYDRSGELLYINRNDDPERREQARTAWREFYVRSFPLADLLAKVRGAELEVPRSPLGLRPAWAKEHACASKAGRT
ncbi:DUF6879 family protein [Actinomadura livida]|uniref:DUF6879 domain-containing protein n=1 Tax=Actinomadura livida TaxID=79909 RepID=A0A7W7IAZ0_9ACTN|nr:MULTISPECIES: DUF6879 family protein [Actinomadura]MBB4773388.1 hypothetical protein [Actinomadura catellatispora]GGU33869.1 hypothetical protein GCM10010208_68200 [Actinomadura livida]